MYLYLLQVKMKILYAYVEGKWPRIILFFDGISYGSTSCTLNCVSIFLIFLNNLYLIKMYISVEKSINKNTRGNFSQDCRIQSYTLYLWRSVDIIKKWLLVFSFSKFTFHLKSKHFTMFQYNIRGLPLFLIPPSQIKMYKTVNISLVYLY